MKGEIFMKKSSTKKRSTRQKPSAKQTTAIGEKGIAAATKSNDCEEGGILRI